MLKHQVALSSWRIADGHSFIKRWEETISPHKPATTRRGYVLYICTDYICNPYRLGTYVIRTSMYLAPCGVRSGQMVKAPVAHMYVCMYMCMYICTKYLT